MSFNKFCNVEMIAPEEKMAMNRNETKRNRFLEKLFIVPAGIPFMP